MITILLDSDYKTASVSTMVINMLSTFYNVRIGLLVGIGGSVSSMKHNICFGDVVVSVLYRDSSSIFQYDFGKSI